MKTKLFTYSLLSVLFAAMACYTFTSCEEIMDTGSTYTMFDEDSNLSSASDTVYSVVGILSLVQKIADRNVLFGELRGDLADENEYTNTDLRDIMNFSVKKDNAYNNYGDYYAVINNCNYFLAKADTALVSETDSNKVIFKKEYAAVKAIRAWTYLQMAQIYKEVPFYTIPLTTVSLSEQEFPTYDMEQLCDFFLTDLAPYMDIEKPDYGSIYNGKTYYSSSLMFFPIRLILGDYCLWCGRYPQAAQYYYDFLVNNRCATGSPAVAANLSTGDKVLGYSDSWTQLFEIATNGSELISIVTLASEKLQGTKSDLENIFSTTEENEYNCPVYPSARYQEISDAQIYSYEKSNNVFTLNGDVRRKVLYRDTKGIPTYPGEVTEGGNLNPNEDEEEGRFINQKSKNGVVYVYRIGQIYLRFAEAVNRAGYPEYAFAVLKYGLNTENISKYIENIESDVPYLQFYSNVFDQNSVGGNWGIHQRGSGSSTAKNTSYSLPLLDEESAESIDTVYSDTIINENDSVVRVEITYHQGGDVSGYISRSDMNATGDTMFIRNYSKEYTLNRVEDLICTEMALENVFEGTRYYDIMRMALHRNDESYLAGKISLRKGEKNKNSSLYNTLLNKENWYLKMEK